MFIYGTETAQIQISFKYGRLHYIRLETSVKYLYRLYYRPYVKPPNFGRRIA